MHIATLGDVMLDVIVDVPDGLRSDDDTEATITLSAGGQAANVATWAVELGAAATLIGPAGGCSAARLVSERLAERGIRFVGLEVADGGVVVSILTGGARTLASDPGDLSWLSRLASVELPDHLDWLHLSGYALLRAADRGPIVGLAETARAAGSRVSVDLSSASLLDGYGARAFRDLLRRLGTSLVFATLAEWAVLDQPPDGAPYDVVLKDGPRGATVHAEGRVTTWPPATTEIVDATGAGDALAAGYLVGGPQLAMRAAGRCVGRMGAPPA